MTLAFGGGALGCRTRHGSHFSAVGYLPCGSLRPVCGDVGTPLFPGRLMQEESSGMLTCAENSTQLTTAGNTERPQDFLTSDGRISLLRCSTTPTGACRDPRTCRQSMMAGSDHGLPGVSVQWTLSPAIRLPLSTVLLSRQTLGRGSRMTGRC